MCMEGAPSLFSEANKKMQIFSEKNIVFAKYLKIVFSASYSWSKTQRLQSRHQRSESFKLRKITRKGVETTGINQVTGDWVVSWGLIVTNRGKRASGEFPQEPRGKVNLGSLSWWKQRMGSGHRWDLQCGKSEFEDKKTINSAKISEMKI